jgi:prephenate dehydrogenase
MTRLAASDARVALAYCRANAERVTRAWRELREDLDHRVAALVGPARVRTRGKPDRQRAAKIRARARPQR